MIDSGKQPPKMLNDLGGHEYPADVMQLIHTLAMALKARSEPFNDLSVMLGTNGPRPRDYIFLFTKTAGFVYELARNLEAYAVAPKVPQLDLLQWLTIITDFKFAGGRKATQSGAALTADTGSTGFEPDSVTQVMADGVLDPPPLLNVRLSMTLDGKEIAHSGPGLAIENIDPEKAKAILIRICERFPGLLSDEPVSGADLVQELTILLRSAL